MASKARHRFGSGGVWRFWMSRAGGIQPRRDVPRPAGFHRACALPALLAMAVMADGCNSNHNAEQPPQVKVTADTVAMATNSPQLAQLTVETVGAKQPVFVPLTGRLVWDEDVTVRVFTPFAGIVRKLMVDVGQSATKGAPLAQIQSADFGQAQADARKAESDFRLADRNLTRLRDLFEHGAAPKKDLEAAEADYDRAQVEKDRASSRLAIYNSKPDSPDQVFFLPSPQDGILVEKNVTSGQEVRPDQMLANLPQFTAPLFVVSDPTKLWVWLDVTEIQLAQVHEGQELTIRSKAFPNRTFKGELDLIGDSLDPTTRTVRARGTVQNPGKLLKAELYVTAEIPDAVPVSLLVPSKAVFLRDNQYYVFLEQGTGRFQRQPVKLGSEREGKVAILDGLKEGQRLVTEGCLLLQSLMDNAPKE
ncbi:MAG: efflux RND transporter periplasmic adaptor subunit [Limisphaerales bacterium]